MEDKINIIVEREDIKMKWSFNYDLYRKSLDQGIDLLSECVNALKNEPIKEK